MKIGSKTHHKFTKKCQKVVLGRSHNRKPQKIERKFNERIQREVLLKKVTRFTGTDSFHDITVDSPQKIKYFNSNSAPTLKNKMWLVSRDNDPSPHSRSTETTGPIVSLTRTIQKHQIASDERAKNIKTEQIFSTKQPDQISTKLNEIWTQYSLPMCD
jgi:hypothetical protein